MTAELVFEAPSDAALATRRGRPEKFTPAIRAALVARPGEFATIQTAKSASRVSVLRRKYGAEGFEFVKEATEDGAFKVFARFVTTEAPAAEVEVEVAAKAPRKRASRAKAAAKA